MGQSPTRGLGGRIAARGPKPREWVSQKLPSKRHVFSAIYLLFNRKTSKFPCIRASIASQRPLAVQASVLFVDQNVTFFPRFTFYLTEKPRKTPALGRASPTVRSRLCLNCKSKRHVFSAIYLLFNRKTPKFPCISGSPSRGRAK